MANEKILQAVADLKKVLPKGVIIQRIDPTLRMETDEFGGWYYQALVGHLLFMTEEIPRMVEAGKRDKAFRWLGFLQGVVWARGWSDLESLKRMNMSDAEKV